MCCLPAREGSPTQDSNLESPAPEADALSIRPRGRIFPDARPKTRESRQSKPLGFLVGTQFCFHFRFLDIRNDAETRDRTGDLQIFSLTLSQLSYRGRC